MIVVDEDERDIRKGEYAVWDNSLILIIKFSNLH